MCRNNNNNKNGNVRTTDEINNTRKTLTRVVRVCALFRLSAFVGGDGPAAGAVRESSAIDGNY